MGVPFCSLGEADSGHAFAQAALFTRCFLQLANESVESVVRLVNEADENVRHHLG